MFTFALRAFYACVNKVARFQYKALKLWRIMARSKRTARTKKSKPKGRGKKEVKDTDENQVAVETTEQPSKRAKLDDAENSPVSSEAPPVTEADKSGVQDSERKDAPAEPGSDSTGGKETGDNKEDEGTKTAEGTDVTQKAKSLENVTDTPACIAAQP